MVTYTKLMTIRLLFRCLLFIHLSRCGSSIPVVVRTKEILLVCYGRIDTITIGLSQGLLEKRIELMKSLAVSKVIYNTQCLTSSCTRPGETKLVIGLPPSGRVMMDVRLTDGAVFHPELNSSRKQ